MLIYWNDLDNFRFFLFHILLDINFCAHANPHGIHSQFELFSKIMCDQTYSRVSSFSLVCITKYSVQLSGSWRELT